MDLSIYEITPQRIDSWLDDLKKAARDSSKRKDFVHELKLLSTLLRYYAEYRDDPKFVFPIKQRHRKATVFKRSKRTKPKELTAQEFLKFRDELSKMKNGEIYAPMATVQYFQAHRVSETAGLHWEDVRFDWMEPAKSRLYVRHAVIWLRQKGCHSFVKEGFKNADANDGVKEQPLFPEAFQALKSLYHDGSHGLIFQVEGKPVSYRAVQYAYNTAFKRAGLPYTATHVMRHGGCQRVYNETGDLAVAQQHLGNSSLQSTLVYAKRKASALSEVAEQHWERNLKLVVGGT